MTVKDVMTLLESPDRVRVIKDGEIGRASCRERV